MTSYADNTSSTFYFPTHISCTLSKGTSFLWTCICLLLIALWFIGWRWMRLRAATYTITQRSAYMNAIFLLIPLKRQHHLSLVLLSSANNKPSGGSKHERLKWYTVWKLSIQLLMSKIQDPEAKAVRERERERERGNYKNSSPRFPDFGPCRMRLAKLICGHRTMPSKRLMG